MTTTSGKHSFARLIASGPLEASPTISKRSERSRDDLTPAKTRGWSSTSSSRIFDLLSLFINFTYIMDKDFMTAAFCSQALDRRLTVIPEDSLLEGEKIGPHGRGPPPEW